jgi:preprotein translocase subunit SecA
METIADSIALYDYLKVHHQNIQLHNAVSNDDPSELIARAGNPGMITIGTNVLTRAADIKLIGTVEKNGGLHVILTFLPDNWRVFFQAIGRASRQGQQGSYQFILSTAHFKNIPISRELLHGDKRALVNCLMEYKNEQALRTLNGDLPVKALNSTYLA